MQQIVSHANSPHGLTAKSSVIHVIRYYRKKTTYLDGCDPSLLIEEVTPASCHHASQQAKAAAEASATASSQ